MIGHALSDTMVPSEGGPDRPVGWIRVPTPLPLEIDRGDGGVYVLDDRQAGPVYVYLRV
jgi:hypothetical protein